MQGALDGSDKVVELRHAHDRHDKVKCAMDIVFERTWKEEERIAQQAALQHDTRERHNENAHDHSLDVQSATRHMSRQASQDLFEAQILLQQVWALQKDNAAPEEITKAKQAYIEHVEVVRSDRKQHRAGEIRATHGSLKHMLPRLFGGKRGQSSTLDAVAEEAIKHAKSHESISADLEARLAAEERRRNRDLAMSATATREHRSRLLTLKFVGVMLAKRRARGKNQSSPRRKSRPWT